MSIQETKTYAITASPEVHRRLERFLALLHYNAGHSGVFGMHFDGDGRDRLVVDPPPDPDLRLPAQRIGGVTEGIEYAMGGKYYAAKLETEMWCYDEAEASGGVISRRTSYGNWVALRFFPKEDPAPEG